MILALTGLSPYIARLSRRFCFKSSVHVAVLQPRCSTPHRFGLFPFRSPLLGKSLYCFLFLGVLRCFSSPRSPTASGIICLQHIGLPHSEISGSKCMCHSPKLIAAYHVLHRLSNPRHPPHALSNFKIFKLLGFLILLTRRYVKELSTPTDSLPGDNPTRRVGG